MHRSLLRPCIALTRAIREAAPEGAASSGKRVEWEKARRSEFGEGSAVEDEAAVEDEVEDERFPSSNARFSDSRILGLEPENGRAARRRDGGRGRGLRRFRPRVGVVGG